MIMAAGGATGGRAGSGAAGAAGSASPPDAGSGSLGDAGVATLTHPGGWQTQADLTRVRAKVAANQTPWITAWNAIKSADATSTYTSHATVNITNAYTIQQDGHAAYVLAIKWAVTGDAAYAKAAMALIDSWTSTVQSVVNEPLRNGLGSAQMANAAEILAFAFDGAAGWPAANAARARKWFVDVVYLPHTKGGASANWGTSAMIGNISMAVFADDVTMFNDAVSTYKHGFQPLSGGCCGVTQYIDATGEDAESGRDQGHSQGGIGHLLEVAQIAWNQGIDLVTYNDNYGLRTYGVTGANRLLLGLEYTAAYNLGNTVPYHPFFEYCNNVTIYSNGISATGRATFGSQFWEMASSLFTSVGVPHPYSAQVLDYAGYVPEATSEDHPGLGTLLFRK
jgi:Alginate lyase